MKRIGLILLLALGCKKEQPAVADAGAVAVAAPAPPEQAGGLQLTPEMLDAYLRYQKTAQAQKADAGAYDQAARDEAALKAVGLTDAQVTKIDEMVSTVIARRMVTQLAANPEFMPDLAQMGQALNEEQKKRMEAAMATFKQQQQAAKDLTEERARFGTKNIDVLLAREQEVTKAWSEMMGLGAYGVMPQVPGMPGMPPLPPPGSPGQ